MEREGTRIEEKREVQLYELSLEALETKWAHNCLDTTLNEGIFYALVCPMASGYLLAELYKQERSIFVSFEVCGGIRQKQGVYTRTKKMVQGGRGWQMWWQNYCCPVRMMSKISQGMKIKKAKNKPLRKRSGFPCLWRNRGLVAQ